MQRRGASRRAAVGIVLGGLLAAGAAVGALGGAGGGSDDEEASAAAAPARAAVQGRGAAAPSAAFEGAAAAETGGDVTGAPPVPAVPDDGALAPGGPRFVRQVELRLEVPEGELDARVAQVRQAAGAAQGLATSLVTDVTDDDGRSAASLVLRVPADRLDGVLDQLRRLGVVESESLEAEDVGGQLVDLGARLTSLRAQEEAYRSILARAQAVPDVLAVQERLLGVRTQIEQLEAQRASLEGQVAMSTITVWLAEPGAVLATAEAREDRSVLAEAAERAGGAALAVIGGTLVVVAALAPLAGLAGLGLAGWALVRRRRRPAPPLPA